METPPPCSAPTTAASYATFSASPSAPFSSSPALRLCTTYAPEPTCRPSHRAGGRMGLPVRQGWLTSRPGSMRLPWWATPKSFIPRSRLRGRRWRRWPLVALYVLPTTRTPTCFELCRTVGTCSISAASTHGWGRIRRARCAAPRRCRALFRRL